MRMVFIKLVLMALICIPTLVFIESGAIQAAERFEPITVNINTSPWFKSFSKYVELYEEETGNKIELNVNPYLGSLEATRNSVRADEGFAHLVVVDNNWLTEFYSGGFLTPLNDIDPNFTLDSGVNKYDGSLFWDSRRGTFNENSGALMAVPINGNVNVLFYREDLYKSHGLKVPKTWEELRENAQKLHDPPNIYGYVIGDDRNLAAFNFFSTMFAWGGSLFKDPRVGDFTITFNSAINKEALDFFVKLGRDFGPPNRGTTGQSDMIQMLVTGKAAHINTVIAAWSQFDDPNKSIVVDKVNGALIPKGPAPSGIHASRAGHWVGAIPKNVSNGKKVAAMGFLKWFIRAENQVKYTEFGSVPVRADVVESPLTKQRPFRFLKALAENSRVARMPFPVSIGSKIASIANLHLNQAIIGKKTTTQALNEAAHEIEAVVAEAGYSTGRLPDLN